MTSVLNSLSLESLEDIYIHDNPDARNEKKKLKKKEIVDAISDKIDTYAIEVFVASLPLADLKSLCEKAKVTFKEEDNKNSRSVLGRRLTEQIVSAGFDDFLGDTADADTLKVVAEDFDVKADKKEIAEAARSFAMERYFTNFDVESLRALAEDLKLKEAAKTSSKRKLVEAIVTQEDAEPAEAPKKKKKKTTDVGKKKALEKGITYDEIFQHYYVEELRDFVKAKGIKVSGKKPVLIKRILAFLAGETEGIMAGDKVEAKKKKKASSKKAAAKKGAASTTSKGKGKKTDAKKEEENGDE